MLRKTARRGPLGPELRNWSGTANLCALRCANLKINTQIRPVLGEFLLKRRSASGTGLGNAPAIRINQSWHSQAGVCLSAPPGSSRERPMNATADVIEVGATALVTHPPGSLRPSSRGPSQGICRGLPRLEIRTDQPIDADRLCRQNCNVLSGSVQGAVPGSVCRRH
jgi:hypothetical protein